jgi:hypothetical protein
MQRCFHPKRASVRCTRDIARISGQCCTVATPQKQEIGAVRDADSALRLRRVQRTQPDGIFMAPFEFGEIGPICFAPRVAWTRRLETQPTYQSALNDKVSFSLSRAI